MIIIATDFIIINEWMTFLIGVVVAIVTAYTTMRAQGKIAYPAAWVEDGKAKIANGEKRIKQLTENIVIAQDVLAVTGNISAQELGVIFAFAADRANQIGGYTMKDAQDVGIMLVEAAKSK